jgi:exoribonuclease-2
LGLDEEEDGTDTGEAAAAEVAEAEGAVAVTDPETQTDVAGEQADPAAA